MVMGYAPVVIVIFDVLTLLVSYRMEAPGWTPLFGWFIGLRFRLDQASTSSSSRFCGGSRPRRPSRHQERCSAEHPRSGSQFTRLGDLVDEDHRGVRLAGHFGGHLGPDQIRYLCLRDRCVHARDIHIASTLV